LGFDLEKVVKILQKTKNSVFIQMEWSLFPTNWNTTLFSMTISSGFKL